MGVIYKITNKINGKIYVGQTRVTEPKRWQQHIWYAYNCPNKDSLLLCYAIKKYGKYNICLGEAHVRHCPVSDFPYNFQSSSSSGS